MGEIASDGARDRIIKASIRLFSEKGFHGTRVNEIAESANVNKALIYYYFKSKEDILDCMMHSVFDSTISLTVNFIHTNIVRMVKDDQLKIKEDRLHFVDEAAVECFLQNALMYYEEFINVAVKNRQILRVLMLESLKSGKHSNALFQLIEFTKNSDHNPVFRTIAKADQGFTYSEDMTLFKFFFSIIPSISFAAYFDEYKRISGLNEDQLRRSLLRSFRIIISSLVSGSDILLQDTTEDGL